MARRLALLVLLACAVAPRRPPPNADRSDSESLDPFAEWDDYEDSLETTPPPRRSPTKPSAKVILRGQVPKVNVTKNIKGDDKNKVIKTSINIESYTNFVMTMPPHAIETAKVTKRPMGDAQVDHSVWSDGMVQVLTRPVSTKKPPGSRRPSTTRRASMTRRPAKTTRRPSTSRHTTTQKYRLTTKATLPPKYKKSACPPKSTGWLSTFFQQNQLKKSPKKETKTGWFLGIFSRIYKWLWGSRSSWFGGTWFAEPQPKQSTTTTTTPVPLTTSTNNWFQLLLDSEENDEVPISTQPIKKPPKKSLRKNYKAYQLLRAYPDVQWKVHEMLELQEEGQGSGLMWWTSPSLNGSTDLLVPPDLLADVKDHLKSNKIEYDVIIYDLQKAITYENPKLSKKQRIELEQLRGHPMTWRRYHRYADILRYLEYLQHSNSDIVELVPLGRSSEGLPLVAVKISLPSNDTQAKESGGIGAKKWKLKSFMKPAVWLDGGSHAREWIAPAVATWMLHALVEGEKGLGPDYELLKMADFFILPVLNPDGYEHSHTHDRLWMKTRSRFTDQSDDYYVGWFPWNWGNTECVGVDVDRNWDYHWGEMDSSRDPCADNYAGPNPFSEPETRAVSEFLAEHRGQIKVGTASEVRQPASGMSHDWAKARAGIKFSYHVDLRDSFGPYGFLLPGSQIVSTARETWQAVKAIVDNLRPG
ncbi:unnamed protein product, partial [Iphiclides podalirius]